MFPTRESLVILMDFMFCLESCFLSADTTSFSLPCSPNRSWTEDTRSRIFSNATLHLERDGQRPELDVQIEQKFQEFDELDVAGRTLLDNEHHLTQMVSRDAALKLCLQFSPCLSNTQVTRCR